MNNKNSRFLALSIAVAAMLAILNVPPSTALAQGTAFTYQGCLNNGVNPVTGSYDLAFSLYGTNTGGSSIAGPVTNSATGVTNGLFTTAIDFGPDVFAGGSNWLAIAVRTNGTGGFTTLTPRQQVMPTPYAVYSANAGSAVTATTATTANSAGSVSAGNIVGTIQIAQLSAGVITNGASGVNLAGSFSGNGAGVTNVSLGSLNGNDNISWGNFMLNSSPLVHGPPQCVLAVDVNGDGHVDLISANIWGSGGLLEVFTNNGTGVFGSNAALNVVGNTSPTALCVADIFGNGRLALILIGTNSGYSTLTVFTNNGSGGFGLQATLTNAVGSRPASVCAADVNGDGHVDLITANYGGNTLTVLTNNGSGALGSNATLTVGSGPVSVCAANLKDFTNGDYVDLISANFGDGTMTVWTNNGSGIFGSNTTFYATPYGGDPQCEPDSVCAANVFGNGRLALICANYKSGELTMFTNNGSGVFGFNARLLEFPTLDSVIATDVNGDGQVDLACASYGVGTLTVLTNNGSGGFGFHATIGAGGSNPQSVVAADVNEDGHVDLVAADSGSGALSVLFNVPAIEGFFSGDGYGLTDLNAANLTGTVPLAQLPDAVVTDNETGVRLDALTVSGNLTLPAGTASTGIIYSGATPLLVNWDANFFAGPAAGNLTMTGSNNVAVGAQALAGDTSGDNNTASGAAALLANTIGNDNTANGYQALYQNLAGNYNTAEGAWALCSNTNGGLNTANGAFALDKNTSGAYNAAQGAFALFSNTTGNHNTANGATALYYNTNGSYNTADGVEALNFNRNGATNTASGYQALQNDNAVGQGSSSGYGDNTAIGYQALQWNITGIDNTAVGYEALNTNTVGYDNTATGSGALGANTQGPYNTAVGSLALASNASGGWNTAVGALALDNLGLSSSSGGWDNIALGMQAGDNYFNDESDNIVIGNDGVAGDNNIIRIGNGQTATYLSGTVYASNVAATTVNGTIVNADNVGIGTTTPGFPLSFANGLGDKISLWGQAGNHYGFGIQQNLFQVYSSGPNADIAFGYGESTNFTQTVRFNADGKVVIGTGNPDYHLLQVASAYCDGTTWVNGSDRNSKEAFTAINPRAVLEKVSALPITEWKYKVEAGGTEHIGPMAQDFHAAFGLNGTDDKHISTVDESGVALAAIQGLNQKLEATQAEAKAKDAEIADLKQSVAELRALVEKLATNRP